MILTYRKNFEIFDLPIILIKFKLSKGFFKNNEIIFKTFRHSFYSKG